MNNTKPLVGRPQPRFGHPAAWGLLVLLALPLGVSASPAARKSPSSEHASSSKDKRGARAGRAVVRTPAAPVIRASGRGSAFEYTTAFGGYTGSLGERATGSAAVRMEREGRWLEFSLGGTVGSKASKVGERLVFRKPEGLSVSYERLENGIKESVTVPARPKDSVLRFGFKQEGLAMETRRDGYHFYGSGKEELFRVDNPVVFDATGAQGGATLSISGSVATIRIEEKFLTRAKYPLVVDPTIVATASQASPAGLSIDRHIVRATTGTLAFFYQSGAGLQYKTSTDNGSSWSGAVSVSPTTSNEFAVFMAANNDIYLTYRGNGVNNFIFFRKLTYSAGAWTTGSERTVENGGAEMRYPSIARENGGQIWVTWRHRTGANTYDIMVRGSTNEGASWSGRITLNNANANASPTAVVYQGRGAIVYEPRDTSIRWRRWNGTAWTVAQNIVAGEDDDDANWGSVTTTSDGRLHLAYAPLGGGWIRYTSYDGSSWSSLYTVSNATGDRYPSISTDGTRLWVVWSRYVGPNQHKIVYRKYAGGTWDTGPKQLTGAEEGTFAKVFLYTGATGTAYSESLVATEYAGSGTARGWRADDASWSYSLPFDFRFYDTTYTSVWVSSNGFLDFTSNNANWNNSTAGMRSRVMIAGMWDDIRTDMAAQPGEDIYVYQPDAHSVIFRWVGETYGTGYPVNLEIRLNDDGTVKFNYGAGNTNLTPTVGVSSGDGSRYTLSTYDGASMLTGVATSVWRAAQGTNWLDRTSDAANTTSGDIALFSNNGDVLYMGSAFRFDYVYFDLQTGASGSVAPSWEYWDGGGWQPLAIAENPSYGFTGSGRISFDPPAQWRPRSLNGSGNLFFVRAVRTASGLGTPPVASQLTSVRNNVQATTAASDTVSIPVGWSEGVASPYSVRFAAVPLVDITLSIQGSYDRDGGFHATPPYAVDFGDMDPDIGSYVTRAGTGQYAVGVDVISDSTWDLTVQANDDLKDGTGNTAPISNLKWAFDGSGTWEPFVKAPASGAVVTGQPANFPTGTALTFDFQFDVDWLTEGSSQPYGAILTYTAVQGS